MKKKFAVFATGWTRQILYGYVTGIRDGLKNQNADIYLFMCYPSLTDTIDFIRGELNIFNLPDLTTFDGAFVLGNAMDYSDVIDMLENKFNEADIPVVYTGKNLENRYIVSADNYVGAAQLCEHLCSEHGARNIFYIAGSENNDDSNTRMKALKDVLEGKGLALSEDNVFYSNWDPKTVIYFVRNWLEQKKPLPDAFVCANDVLAMLTCNELREHGYKVPDDVLVTGFDNEFYAQIYDPSISSVDQRFDNIGVASVELMTRLINGEKCEKNIKIPCEFIPSESCGCTSAKNFEKLRRDIGRNKYLDDLNASAFFIKLSRIERGVAQGKCYSDLKENMKQVHNSFNNYEGGSFHVLLDPMYEEIITNPSARLKREGYPSKMDVIFSIDEWEYMETDYIYTKDIVPYVKNPDKNHLFICVPLQENGGSMGYVVFADDYEKILNASTMQKYVERLNIVLSKYLQTLSIDILNKRLFELSETDALTHVKNRNAYNSRVSMMDRKISGNKTVEFGVVMFDLNNLKKINDMYGHEKGDYYIKNSCMLICKIFKRSAVYRIGGDEFAIIVEGEDYVDIYGLMHKLDQSMKKIREKESSDWERISIASGYAEYNSKTDKETTDVINRADHKMYENKITMKLLED